MNCPACRRPLPAGQDRCPSCGPAGLPVEGALAPDPKHRPRAAVEPIRELPGKRRERTWKDEVRERVDRRRQVRGDAPEDEGVRSELPLFPDAAEAAAGSTSTSAQDTVEAPAAPETEGPRGLDDPSPRLEWDSLELHDAPRPDPLSLLGEPPATDETREPAPVVPGRPARPADSAELPLRGVVDTQRGARAPEGRAFQLDDAPDEDWPLDTPRAAGDPRPIERPARPFERLQAGLIDAGVLVGLAALVVYFAGRVAQVPLPGLRPAWPFLAAYLAFLGLVYAAYFTGTSGQTVGKIVLGLRVVDTAGRAPGYARALLRGALGALGTLLVGLGHASVPFDPARRALHDRLFRTRVVSVRRA